MDQSNASKVVAVEVPRVTDVDPDVHFSEDIVPDIVLDSSDHEMMTVKSIFSEAGLSSEGVSSMVDVVANIASSMMIPSMNEALPSVGSRTMTDAVSVEPALAEDLTTVAVVAPKSGFDDTVSVDLNVDLNN